MFWEFNYKIEDLNIFILIYFLRWMRFIRSFRLFTRQFLTIFEAK